MSPVSVAAAFVESLVLRCQRYARAVLPGVRHRMEHVRDPWPMPGMRAPVAVDAVSALRRVVPARGLVRERKRVMIRCLLVSTRSLSDARRCTPPHRRRPAGRRVHLEDPRRSGSASGFSFRANHATRLSRGASPRRPPCTLPPPLKLRRDLAEAPSARRRALARRFAGSRHSRGSLTMFARVCHKQRRYVR